MIIHWDGKSKNICGRNVLRLRKTAKLTQEQLASKLQVLGYEFSSVTIGRIEKDQRFVSDLELKALAEVFNVDVNELLK